MAFHPLHVSMVSMDYNSEAEKCIVSVKVFSDDFIAILREKYGLDLLQGRDTIRLKDTVILNSYVHENLKISLNGKLIPMNKWIMDSVNNNFEASWLYYSFEYSELLQEISVRNTIFFDSFSDQTNLMVVSNGKKEKALQFTHRKPVFTIRF